MLINGKERFTEIYNSLYTKNLDEFDLTIVELISSAFINMELETDNHIKAKQDLLNKFQSKNNSILNPTNMFKDYLIVLLEGSDYNKWLLTEQEIEIINVNNVEECFDNIINWIQLNKVYTSSIDTIQIK